jgi:hypothetical protein
VLDLTLGLLLPDEQCIFSIAPAHTTHLTPILWLDALYSVPGVYATIHLFRSTMSDSEDELNVDLSQWKPRTVNAAPEPPAPAPRTFASINTPAAAPAAANHLDDDDFDIDAIIEGIADDDNNTLQSRASTPPPPTTTTRRHQHTVQVVITKDPNFNRDDYTDCTYGANIVRRVLKEITKNQDVYYNAEFVDRHTEQVSTFTTAILILPVVA